jgi:hypothetical protein
LAVRGYVIAKTGWTLDYINGLPELHLLFVYHHLKKDEDHYWNEFGRHLGTTWEREQLERMLEPSKGNAPKNSRIFVPLSLVLNPDLPSILLGRPLGDRGAKNTPPGEPENRTTGGDGLYTGMALPGGEEIVNMGDLSKDEFFGLVAGAGMVKS